jgi:hypothetical protein
VKLFVTETAQKAALEGMQMLGGYGYSSEYDVERLVRSTLASTIYGGTSEIQRGIIAQDARALVEVEIRAGAGFARRVSCQGAARPGGRSTPDTE